MYMLVTNCKQFDKFIDLCTYNKKEKKLMITNISVRNQT